MPIKLDEIDIQLLVELQADADKTNVELARITGLSPAATLHRVRALKESGVIRIVRAHVDPALVGFPLQVFVMATLPRHDPRSGARFEAYVRSLPQVIGADSVAGETDYILSVVARDVAELAQVLAGLSGRGGERLVTYLRLAEGKPPSPVPLGEAEPKPGRRPRGGPRAPLGQAGAEAGPPPASRRPPAPLALVVAGEAYGTAVEDVGQPAWAGAT